jgi:hypothetical protein
VTSDLSGAVEFRSGLQEDNQFKLSGEGELSLLHSVYIGLSAFPTSFGTVSLVNRQGYEADHSPALSAEVYYVWSHTSIHHRSPYHDNYAE